ncbi:MULTISPECIES: hypothetical protein [unclassified Bradyrhizobium]|nr:MULTISPECIES: hypothetical protein [unclassified Bradyrhizobium]
MAINKEWHRSHRMPLKATREQRVKWHAAQRRRAAVATYRQAFGPTS